MNQNPNFFIVGAPKCGTTALATYLSEHPAVCMSRVKEPNHFCTDLYRPTNVSDRSIYLSLFRAKQTQKAIGEASVWYLFSKQAITNIMQFAPGAKVIVMLRNPADMFVSLHAQLLFSQCEDEEDLTRAWELNSERADGKCLPRSVRSGMFPGSCTNYLDVCSTGRQVERLLSAVPRSQVLPLIFDDFAAAPDKVYREVLSFLELDNDNRTNFKAVNVAKRTRFKWLANPINSGTFLGKLSIQVRRRLGVSGFGITKAVRRFNSLPAEKAPIPDSFRRELTTAFEDDVRLLSSVLNRDLSSWLGIAGEASGKV